MKIRPVGAELFHADGRTDMTKLMVAFRNFANAPKNCPSTSVSDSSCHGRMVGIPATYSDVLRSRLEPESGLPHYDYLWGYMLFLATANIVSRPTLKHVTAASFHIASISAMDAT
jgi:hypothetical protein